VEGSLARSFAARSSEGLRTGVFGELGSASDENLLLLLLLLLLRITGQKACDDMGDGQTYSAPGLTAAATFFIRSLALLLTFFRTFDGIVVVVGQEERCRRSRR